MSNKNELNMFKMMNEYMNTDDTDILKAEAELAKERLRKLEEAAKRAKDVVEEAESKIEVNSGEDSLISFVELERLIEGFNNRKDGDVGRGHVIIAGLLEENHGIRRQFIYKHLFMVDQAVNAYDRIIEGNVSRIIRGYGFIPKDADVKTIISYINDDLEPVYNTIKFNNGVYDLNKHKKLNLKNPILTHRQVDFNYNKCEYPNIYAYLNSSLRQATDEETENYLKGIMEIIGYFFVSGNIESKMFIITGRPGAGKSTFINLLNEIFERVNISNTGMSRLTQNQFGSSGLLHKVLNVSNDTDNKPLNEIGLYKQISGYDNVEIEKKGVDQESFEREVMPKLILVGNGIPEFKGLDDALLSRMIIIRFRHLFRDTKEENKAYSKGFNKAEVEGFVYDCLDAYKNHAEKDSKFILAKPLEETVKVMEMYTKPYEFLVDELLIYNPNANDSECLLVSEVYDAFVKLADEEGIELRGSEKVRKNKILNAIRAIVYDNVFGEAYNTAQRREGEKGDNKRFYPGIVKNKFKWDILYI